VDVPIPTAGETVDEAAAANGLLTSPVARRLLNDYGLDAAQVRGTGIGGRITRNDVYDAAADKRSAGVRAASAVSATGPHAYTSVEIDFEHVERARRGVQPKWRAREGFALTYLPFIVRALCDAVAEYPSVNASVEGETLLVHGEVHVAMAVGLDFDGLVTPVIHNTGDKRLRFIAREIHDLTDRARNEQLLADEIVGGTLTLTNSGQRTRLTLPTINPPQVSNLSVGGIYKRPWVVTSADGEDSLAIRHIGVLALTWDHRAFDGAYAAAFLGAIKRAIESRYWAGEIA